MNDTNNGVKMLPRCLLLCGLAAACFAACDNGGVEYGPPRGLRIPAKNTNTCPLPSNIDEDNCPDWTSEVYPILTDTKYSCANAGCHGSIDNPGGSFYFPEDDAAVAYNRMLTYEARDGSGRTYISTKGADQAYLLCNLNPDDEITVGAFMPRQGFPNISAEDLKVIGEWVNCGMQLDGGGGGGGPGGGGGMAGMGGAGGAGGMAGGGGI